MLTALVLTTLLLLFEWLLIGTPYGHYFRSVSDGGIWLAAARVGLLALTLVLQVLFFTAWIRAGWVFRVVYAVIFGGVTYVQYGYVMATGGFIIGHDFEVAIGAPMHWRAMAQHFGSVWSVVPVTVCLLVLSRVRPVRGASPMADLRMGAVVMALTVVGHGLYVLPHVLGPTGRNPQTNAGQPLVSTQGFARSLVQFGVTTVTSAHRRWQRGERTPVPSLAREAPTRHLVLIVDESIRADRLSLNGYHRPTTPFLEQLQAEGQLANWGVAASTTPFSNDSVLCLLTGVQNLPDGDLHALTWPTVFQYAKAAGFETHWLEGGAWRRRFGFDANDFRFVDHWQTRHQFGDDPATDLRIAETVATLISKPRGQFIVVLKRGNHMPAADNYPPEAAQWLPDQQQPSGGPDAWLTRLDNSYDNAVHHVVDRFFETLLRQREVLERSTILYTSDHGQALRRFQLGGPVRRIHWEDVAVPLLLIGGSIPPVDTGYRAHHANILPTLLDLMRVPPERPGGRYARSLLTATANDHDGRMVFTGDFFGRGAFTRVDFDQLDRPVRR